MFKNKFNLIFVIVLLILISPVSFALINDSNMKIFAVSSNDTAMDANLSISLEKGSGKIYSSIDNSLVGSSTQDSIKNSINAADLVLEKDIKQKYNFTFDIESNAYSIDGPSAGSAMSLLLISMFRDVQFPENVSMTGTITSDGYIGNVGGIYEKSKKAADVGIDLFFIPKGNREQVITEDGELKNIDLVNYAQKNWDLKIIEVNTLDQVLKYAFKDIDSIDLNSQDNTTNKKQFIPNKIEYSKALNPMRDLVDNYIKDVNNSMTSLKKDIQDNNSLEQATIENLYSVINSSKKNFKKAQVYSENNYLYSAANNVFLSYINVISVKQVLENPSVLSSDSIAFDIALDDLKNRIKLTKNRLQNCSLNQFEWCIGAKQRLTWAENKLKDIKGNKSSMDSFSKISNYSYAYAWVDISNDFLDIGITDSKLKFVEANKFKDLAQEYLIKVENQLTINDPTLSNSPDFKRRFDAAKKNFNRGWYVTSLYDSASALSIIDSYKYSKSKNINKANIKSIKEELSNNLRSLTALNNEYSVWSKLYFDHALYYYKSNSYYENKDQAKSNSDLETSLSLFLISKEIYNVESKVLDFYNSADVEVLIEDVNNTENTTNQNTIDESMQIDTKKDNNKSQNVYVYSKGKKDVWPYILVVGLFLIIGVIIYEIERLKKANSKEGLLKQIAYIDELLLEGKISPFTYKEMRHKYLEKLKDIKQKQGISKTKIEKEHLHLDNLSPELEKRILENQITDLEKRKKHLLKSSKSKKSDYKKSSKSKKSDSENKSSKKSKKKNLKLKKDL